MITTLKSLCLKAIIDENLTLHKYLNSNDIEISKTKNKKFGHFQLNSIMKLAKIANQNPMLLAKKIELRIKKNIKNNEITTNTSYPGFINFTFSEIYINQAFKKMLKNNNYKNEKKNRKNIIIDYSSPNIAKDMHVGHLRSTIVGECLSNVLHYLGNKIIKINHLGDWGTQFGILINYLKEKYTNENINKTNITLSQLSNYYKTAQIKFNNDIHFKINSKKEVVKLQKKDKSSIKIWKKITTISKHEYKKIYSLLNINIKYKGESFYNEMLPSLIKKIENKKMITQSQNAKCIYINGFKNKEGKPLPIIIQKSDGGFNYTTTDLAAIYYRIKYNKAQKIIYITDAGQSNHFEMLFRLTEKLKLNTNNTTLIHIPLGLMLNTDGKKIKTRSGKSEKLIDFLQTSITNTKKIIKNKNKNKKNISKHAEIIGINTIKYAELSNKISQNYIFDYQKILQYNGNTASFLMYAYVRLNSIKNKIKNITIKEYNINIKKQEELDLIIHLLQFKHTIKKTAHELNPNILTLYLYELSEKFHSFFHQCKVINSNNENSRIKTCQLTQKILKNGLKLLGLKTLNKM